MAKAGRRPGRPRAVTVDMPTSDRILQVAAALFIEQGYEAVGTDEVARKTGVTKAMVYYYFSSKAGLFTAAMVLLMENIRNRTGEILRRDLPLYDKLLTVAVARLSIPRSRNDFQSILRSVQGILSEEQLSAMNEAEERLMGLLVDAFRDGVTNGELRPIDASLAAHLYVAILSAGERQLAKANEDRADREQRHQKEGKAHGHGADERPSRNSATTPDGHGDGPADAPGDAPGKTENRDPAVLAGRLVDLFWYGITS